jgi:hypothetical protein
VTAITIMETVSWSEMSLHLLLLALQRMVFEKEKDPKRIFVLTLPNLNHLVL